MTRPGTRSERGVGMLDRRQLSAGDPEFVVIGDTHYMRDKPAVEFESRRRQTARIDYAIDRINALDPDFVVHLGDLVQAYPGSGDYEPAMDAALAQLDRLDPAVHFVAGNHDVGDKPDPTMPTDPVSRDTLEAYHDRLGRSWFAWEAAGCHFLALNSQIMNGPLDAADDQRAWFEDRLAAVDEGPIFVFLHLPPYLVAADDPTLGHYDTLGEPARSWLVERIAEHPVVAVFAGHCHFAFAGRIGDASFRVVPSVSFTRPGFAELFSSPPPPERGRDEAAKLGFAFVRVVDGDPVIRTVRTNGRTEQPQADPDFLPRTAAELPASPVGANLAHPVTDETQIPETFPSATRYPVTNAYPTLGCLGMGVSTIRLPVAELDDGASRAYLDLLRGHGVTVVGTVLGAAGPVDRSDPLLDEIEVRLPGASADTGDGLASLRPGINLSRVVPKRDVPGKQHGRLGNGFDPSALADLNGRLADHELTVDRVTCRVPDSDDPWTAVREGPDPTTLDRIDAIDWLLSSMNASMAESVDRIARTLAAVATRGNARVYLSPLRAMDRTMDPAPGLLDRRCNPTPASTAVAILNTVLFGEAGAWRPTDTAKRADVAVIGLTRGDTAVRILLPPASAGAPRIDAPVDGADTLESISLTTATVRRLSSDRAVAVDEPTLLIGPG